VDIIGSGGRDRTADLGVMNHHLGKNLSLCLLYGCSHQEFSNDFHPFRFFPVPYMLLAVNSGHKLDTPKAGPRCRLSRSLRPSCSAELRIAKWTTGRNVSICLFKSCSHQEISRVFPFLPIPYHRLPVASCSFWPRIGHLEFHPKACFEMPNRHLKHQDICTRIRKTKSRSHANQTRR
jgi:hypothetical protein